jgi:rhamnose transport system substrate-binding protein
MAPRSWRYRLFPNGEDRLLIAIIAEILLFDAVAPNFFSQENFFEILRFSVELGLLALALTPVIVTGGIDLSVGSLLGFTAVTFGFLVNDLHVAISIAAILALLAATAGGALNAALVAFLELPPLVVTLGSLSLFRGLAEGLTKGAVNYSGFPAHFLFLGQGYVLGVVPTQILVFCAALFAYSLLLHRSTIGRAVYAIGFGPAGARYAGIPVRRRIGLVYILSGLLSGIAALIYVAHLGQAKSDTGSGYELDAITAVVLGGTSIFGGRGTIGGTCLGLLFLAVLQNGLHLAALPSELTGILTGVLLVLVIAFDPRAWKNNKHNGPEERNLVKNSQVAVLCGAVLFGSLIVAGTNIWLIRSLKPAPAANSQIPATEHRPVIAVMPKAKGDPYFASARAGAEEAAQELGVDLLWDGPTGLDAAKQNELVENWITRRVDAIAVAVENKASISTVLRKARERGIHVLTWDADAEPDARDFFVNQATPEGIASTLTAEAARLLKGQGEFAIITGALSAANQNEWIANIKKLLAANYPNLKLATIRPSDDDRDKAFVETQTIMKVYPQVKLVMAISAPAVPGSAEAVRQSGKRDIAVIGLSLPSICKPYIHDGVVPLIVLWNTRDLGYLTVYSSAMAVRHKLGPETKALEANRLGNIEIRGSEILLGKPLVIDKANVDKLNF